MTVNGVSTQERAMPQFHVHKSQEQQQTQISPLGLGLLVLGGTWTFKYVECLKMEKAKILASE